MRERASILASVTLALLLTSCGGASDTGSSDDETGNGEPTGRYVVGLDADVPPFASTRDGDIVGIDVDVLEAVCAEQACELSFVATPWADLLDALADGDVDIAAGAIARTSARAEAFALTIPYYLTDDTRESLVFAVRSGSDLREDLDEGLRAIIEDGTLNGIRDTYGTDEEVDVRVALGTFHRDAGVGTNILADFDYFHAPTAPGTLDVDGPGGWTRDIYEVDYDYTSAPPGSYRRNLRWGTSGDPDGDYVVTTRAEGTDFEFELTVAGNDLLEIPSGIVVGDTASSSVDVTWNHVPSADRYNIAVLRRYTDDGRTVTLNLGSVEAMSPATEATVPMRESLVPGTEYLLTITALTLPDYGSGSTGTSNASSAETTFVF